ncbi:hypothetical protein K1T71_005290 [Dendrolimus kikuchii]|uniref:Uncharacterized protein n=3 Tax=Dendrolimus kikuchii TaxID=765133 RepID=A0ACC1CRW5_9NEOP|nr:hypothetical protein K1T71_011838 [Dendrolimus kikuchii]KAJ0174409.1 hypothetical protein K1T71_009517 [Dendrolimus kikuchii]KAJ0179578.1 hypothetical protein K1T71_005290 [Dendrolimus kikuchii]
MTDNGEQENIDGAMHDNMSRSQTPKRDRESDEEDDEQQDWTVVRRKEKKLKAIIEMYVTSNEVLPKLFAMAKIFKSIGVIGVNRIKFMNSYKIRIDVDSETSAQKIESSQELIDRGWRISRAMETNLSFGVIRNVEMNVEEKEIIENISCPSNAEVLSAYRLNQRNKEEDGWVKSEAVRLCFKGSYLPAYVSIHGTNVKVEPYVFRVSQCGKCWRLGHSTKKCPKSKPVCPKCAGEHTNCETKQFKCVNCGGNHMALAKSSCSVFLKEKKLREIMAEFNCTYRRALTIYVPPPCAESIDIKDTKFKSNFMTSFDDFDPPNTSEINNEPTFAEVVKIKPDIVHKKKKMRQRPNSPYAGDERSYMDVTSNPGGSKREEEPHEGNEQRNVNFKELLKKLKEAIFMRGATIHTKIKMVIKYCIEWMVLLVVDYIPDWPILQNIMDFICNNG